MQSRRLDTRKTDRMQKILHITTENDIPTVPRSAWKETPDTSPGAMNTSTYEDIRQENPPTALKGKIAYDFEEDAWLNDVKPPQFSKNAARLENSWLVSQQPPSSTTKEYIGPGYRLWPIVLRLSERIWHELREKIDGSAEGMLPVRTQANIEFVKKRFLALLREEKVLASLIHNATEAEHVMQCVIDEVVGYGPLEFLLKDEGVTEIIAVGPRMICAERKGEIQNTLYVFEDDHHMLRIIENMLRCSGHQLQFQRPIADLCLPNGFLATIVMPPNVTKGPTIALHRRANDMLKMHDLVKGGILTKEMSDFLAACVRGHLNIGICGGRGSGKTTLLNALCRSISSEERIITIEDVPELQLSQKQVVPLITQTTGSQDTAKITMLDLVRQALRMYPQRILIGECRGEETAELFQALDAGYSGSLMTIYANNLRNCLTRLETMLASGEEGPKLTSTAARAKVANCLDMLVYVSRIRDGSYKILNIAEAQDVEANVIRLQSLFHYQDDGIDTSTGRARGTFEPGGFLPTFASKLEARGITLPEDLFTIRHNSVMG